MKVLALRRAGVCGCGAQLAVGTRAGWDRLLRVVVCLDCLEEGLRLSVSGPEDVASIAVTPEPPVASGEAEMEPTAV